VLNAVGDQGADEPTEELDNDVSDDLGQSDLSTTSKEDTHAHGRVVVGTRNVAAEEHPHHEAGTDRKRSQRSSSIAGEANSHDKEHGSKKLHDVRGELVSEGVEGLAQRADGLFH